MFLAATLTVLLAAAAGAQERNASEATRSILQMLFAASKNPAQFKSEAPCSSFETNEFQFECDDAGELTMLAFPCCLQFDMPELVHLTGLTSLTFTGGVFPIRFTQRFLAEPLPRLRMLRFLTARARTMPTELGRFSSLTSLVANASFTVGSIPSELGALRNLTELRITRNSFPTKPVVPTEIALLTALTTLDLADNKLLGDIDLRRLTNLVSVTLYGNDFKTVAIGSGGGRLQSCVVLNTTVPTCALSCPHTCDFDCAPRVCDCDALSRRCDPTTQSTSLSAASPQAQLYSGTAFRAAVGITVAIGLFMLTIIALIGFVLVFHCCRLRRGDRADAAVDD